MTEVVLFMGGSQDGLSKPVPMDAKIMEWHGWDEKAFLTGGDGSELYKRETYRRWMIGDRSVFVLSDVDLNDWPQKLIKAYKQSVGKHKETIHSKSPCGCPRNSQHIGRSLRVLFPQIIAHAECALCKRQWNEVYEFDQAV